LSQFLNDFQILVSLAATTSHEFLITGDFNLHLDDYQKSQTNQFLSVLDSFNLVQLVTFPTHHDAHTLDLIITTADSSPKISYSRISPSDHFPVYSQLSIQPLPKSSLLTEISFICFDAKSIPHFVRDIFSSTLIHQAPSSLSELVNCYNTTLTDILDKHAPLKTKRIHSKSPNPRFTSKLRALKTSCHFLQKIWARSRSAFDLQCLRSATNKYHAAIIKAKCSFHASVSSNITNPHKLWTTFNKILHRKISNSLPHLP
jgi:Endonuclease-reverse transcriptase